MATDLSKIEAPGRNRGRPTRNRDTVIPARRDTNAPALEVNARIQRPNQSGAQELQKILGLAEDTAEAAIGMYQERQKKKDDELGSKAALDFESGSKDQELFDRFSAYRRSWSIQGAKSAAVDVDIEATDAVTERLNNEDDPATLDDIDEVIDEIYSKAALGEDGKPLDFGDPKAARILANQMTATRARLRSAAAEAIKTRTDTRLVNTVAHNAVAEAVLQAPIGADPVTGADVEDDNPKPRRVAKAPTGKLPVPGVVTSTAAQHRARGSAGVDLDGKLGDPVMAPAAATVQKVGHDARSGNFVVLDHGNGVVSTYSHLKAKPNLTKGAFVDAGQTFAQVGNTGNVRSRGGDGSHLHYRIKVNGKDVDPLSYTFAADGVAPPDGSPVQVAQSAPVPTLKVDFEAAMAKIPQSVSRGFAKKTLMTAFVNLADERGDPQLLDSLISSTRADGTPSFDPAEKAMLLDERRKIRVASEREADKIRNDRYEKNSDAFYTAYANGNPPSREAIRAALAKDDISAEFAYALTNHMDAEERAEQSQARSEARQADYAADNETAMVVASEGALLRTGAIEGTTIQSIDRRFRAGEFGVGKKAVAHVNALRAALREGQQVALQNPEAKRYGALIQSVYGKKVVSSRVAQALGGNQFDAVAFAGMTAEYEREVRNGTPPNQAYLSAVSKWAPEGEAKQKAVAGRRRYLEAKASGRLHAGR